eukprot:scaffold874_cov380-Prasinococcus_capsulatus_cf.AAC.8
MNEHRVVRRVVAVMRSMGFGNAIRQRGRFPAPPPPPGATLESGARLREPRERRLGVGSRGSAALVQVPPGGAGPAGTVRLVRRVPQ